MLSDGCTEDRDGLANHFVAISSDVLSCQMLPGAWPGQTAVGYGRDLVSLSEWFVKYVKHMRKTMAPTNVLATPTWQDSYQGTWTFGP